LNCDGNYPELEGENINNAFINGGGNDVIIEDCTFVNMQGTCIIKTEGKNLTIRDCISYDFRDHFVYQTHDGVNVFIENCVSYDDIYSRGVYKMRHGSSGMTLINCSHYGGGQFFNLHSDEHVVSDVLIENCYAEVTMSFLIFQNSNDLLTQGVEVTNSKFKDVSAGGQNIISLNWGSSASVDGLKIQSCEFIGFNGRMILSGIPSLKNKNIKIDSCIIKTREDYTGANSLAINYLENLMFSNNHVYGQYTAISTGTSNKSLYFIGNTYYDINTAIDLDSRSLTDGNIFIKDNRFDN